MREKGKRVRGILRKRKQNTFWTQKEKRKGRIKEDEKENKQQRTRRRTR